MGVFKLPRLGLGKKGSRFISGRVPFDARGYGTEWDVLAIVISPSPDLNGQLWHLVRGDGLTGNFVVLEKPSLIVPVQDDAVYVINGVPVVFLYVSGSGAIKPLTARDALLSLLNGGVVVKCVDVGSGLIMGSDDAVDYIVTRTVNKAVSEDHVECTVSTDVLNDLDVAGGGAGIIPIDNQRVLVIPIRKSVLNDLVFRSALDRHVTASASNYPALLQTAVDLARAKTQQFMASSMRIAIIVLILFAVIAGFFLMAPALMHGLSSITSFFHLPSPP